MAVSAEQVEQMQRRFGGHPVYRGRTVDEVRAELRDEVGRDQRQYALALEGAEEQEGAALAAVLELERRWGEFDFGWSESDPATLANRIVAFEWERETRRDLVPFAEYKRASESIADSPAGDASASGQDRPWWAFWRS